ncbi:MAG: hypothetical protein Q8M02_04085 [Candidatus Didemnitutus sp.]|nr:hypothetical protein [Candidatus Didemnitutus sp.]
MKSSLNNSLLLAASLVALSLMRLAAHPEHEISPPPIAEHVTREPDAIVDILQEISRQQSLLEQSVEERKLGSAHDHAFAIRDLAKALAAKVPDANRETVASAVTKISEIATAIDKSAAASAQKTTAANVKNMAEAIKALLLALPHGH